MVGQVTLIGNTTDTDYSHASIKTRYNRNPVIGDKFSSRSGQKGVLSQLWPDVDMPYSEATGMRCAEQHPDTVLSHAVLMSCPWCISRPPGPRQPPQNPRDLHGCMDSPCPRPGLGASERGRRITSPVHCGCSEIP